VKVRFPLTKFLQANYWCTWSLTNFVYKINLIQFFLSKM
jgi:hypothetical protein